MSARDKTQPPQEPVIVPALLRASRRTYGSAIRRAQFAAGFDDVPRHGSFVLGGMNRFGLPLSDLIRQSGLSKQAASLLVDTLVHRGYLARSEDPEDRRRLIVVLTARGRAAAEAGRKAVDEIDQELAKRVGSTTVDRARDALVALIQIGEERGAFAPGSTDSEP